jgi:prepilin-type N-terminal cleavage/methylation domain-containing protein
VKIRQKTGSLGFTLIELLVVIAVIAIVSALLFTTLFRSREEELRPSTASGNVVAGEFLGGAE